MDNNKNDGVVTIVSPEYFKMKVENKQLRSEVTQQKKRHNKLKKNAKFLRTIVIAEAAALVISVGVPNIINSYHRKQGRESIVTELEDNNMIPRDLDWIDTDRGVSLQVGGEELKITSYVDYLTEVYDDAMEDGCTPEKMAVGFYNANVPLNMIKDITGCDKKDIKDIEMSSYYEIQLESEKSVGGVKK